MRTLIIFFILFSSTVFAWDGYDYESGSHVEIDNGNLVREGEDIEVYDYGSREYKNVTVNAIDGYGSSLEVEVYDHNTGEYRTFDMDQ